MQFLAAAVAGVLLFYRTVVAKVKSIFGIKPKSQDGFADSIDTKEEADQ